MGINNEGLRIPELGTSGRAGAIEEFNLGQPGTIIGSQQEGRDEDGTRLLSGRVVGIQGRTLYVERSDRAVVPLDMSALRVKKQPKVGQQVIAEYQVADIQNVCVSLAGEVESPPSAK
jgi:lipopolysaccharide export system protein LptA